ncbi:hypothetical protein NLI96_g2942 [Meripilus lineatus]|uniref:Uncharacterized protein n=1 Tax=Meripilus lineatus TaxID=2056292 RepID=A0AAD5YJI3_9APHY|nr:hypothetical protein NLI96_g2942 [Physisporinus lineatus]
MIKSTFASVIALAVITATPVVAVCPGFNFALQDLGNQNYRAYDDSCNAVETWIYTGTNPCTSGTFSCSPPPIQITGAKILGNWYACRPDPNSGSCGGHTNNYCCRNDGN